MLADLLLAIAHHLLIFALFGLLVTEMVMLKPEIPRATVFRLARIDTAFGIVAGLILIVGVGRVFFGLKGYEYYAHSPAFWAKIAAFVVIGLLSIQPTTRIIQWRKAAAIEKDDSLLPVAQHLGQRLARSGRQQLAGPLAAHVHDLHRSGRARGPV